MPTGPLSWAKRARPREGEDARRYFLLQESPRTGCTATPFITLPPTAASCSPCVTRTGSSRLTTTMGPEPRTFYGPLVWEVTLPSTPPIRTPGSRTSMTLGFCRMEQRPWRCLITAIHVCHRRRLAWDLQTDVGTC